MDKLAAQQQQIGKDIQTIVSNFNKDPDTRKATEAYYKERLQQLESAYEKFEAIDTKIRDLPDVSVEHKYFATEYYSKITELRNEYKALFEAQLSILCQKKPQDSVPTKLMSQQTPTSLANPDVQQAGRSAPESGSVSVAQHPDNAPGALTSASSYIARAKMLHAQLDHLIKGISGEPSTLSKPYCEVKLKALTDCWNQLDSINSKLQTLVDDPEACGYNTASFFTMQDRVLMKMIELSERLQQGPVHGTMRGASLAPTMKLPTIELPKFDGTYLKWRQFRDLYNEIIHNQPISACEKFWYLRSSLSGEAQSLIKHLPLSSSNYVSAWELLTNRYDNERLLVSATLTRLLTQPSSTSETSSSIKSLHDVTQECILSLQNLGISTKTWDPILLHILSKKLDRATLTLYEQSLTRPRSLQSLTEFLMFLETRFQSLEAIGTRPKGFEERKPTSSRSLASTTAEHCISCTDNHAPYLCPAFMKLTPSQRLTVVKKHNRCLNCLQPGHLAGSCTRGSCKQCSKKHNTLLHFPPRRTMETPKPVVANNSLKSVVPPYTKPIVTSSTDNSTSLSAQVGSHKHSYMMLSTVQVQIQGESGPAINCRAILDSGSQINILTEAIRKKLQLRSHSSNMQIQGIGDIQNHSRTRVNFKLESKVSAYTTRVEAFILPKIMSSQPSQSFDIDDWKIPQNIKLADPDFHKPGKIDLLLGVEFYHQLLTVGQIRLGADLPVLQNTTLGWIVAGRVGRATSDTQATCGISTQELSEQIERFWQLDTIPRPNKHLSPQERKCETHFAQHTSRDKDGRFVVALPFKGNPTSLGKSADTALRRFRSLEDMFKRRPELHDEYAKFMDEFESLGHMEEINDKKVPPQNYYLPHHCVLKPDSTTTKLRVVFDASAKSSTNISLNDILMKGPTVQDSLFSILLRFRLPKYVITADIEKMYRQIKMQPMDQFYQLIVWRKNEDDKLKHYKLKTVTYGTKSAPYLATKCLQRLASDRETKYPLAAKALKHDCYVDDIMTGSDSLPELLAIQSELKSLLAEAGFKLRKWSSNHIQALKLLPPEDIQSSLDIHKSSDDDEDYVKTLGLAWKPRIDNFRITISSKMSSVITKRTISSDIFRIFDPLGLVAPIVSSAKVFLQEVCALKLHYDAALPQEMCTRWAKFREELKCIEDLFIPRHVFAQSAPRNPELHVFADASTRAYGAAVYIRSSKALNITNVCLLCSKSYVAPPKRITLPRLELCAAVLAAELASRVKESINMSDIPTYFWSDSTIVLSWINSSSSDFHVFVANRIGTIQELSQPDQWHHVRSEINPADLLTRPMSPSALSSHRMWFHGPLFLYGNRKQWLITPPPITPTNIEDDPERKVISLTVTDSANFIYNINHKNSFNNLVLIVGFMLRFISKCRRRHEETTRSRVITAKERQNAIRAIIKAVQIDFKDDIKYIQRHGHLHESNNLHQLKPFVDTHGILRVGGRLTSSHLPYDAKHPVLLPYNDSITKLIMKDIHETNSHVGPQALLSITRQRYWPLKGSSMARSIFAKCIVCCKAKPTLLKQIMGDLPQHRVQPARPFINSGVDFCGPVYYHFQIRGKQPQKTYIAVFVCFASKAVHLELVSDLSTNAFLGALRRFISRRGHVRNLYCDNATNFVGASNQLHELQKSIYSSQAQDNIAARCSEKGIDFHFIPPRSPHFGGLWEAGVKSAKTLLLKAVGREKLTHEQLETVLTEIEAILNSRPLTPMSSNPNDYAAITPGDLLIGEPLIAQVDPEALPRKGGLANAWAETRRVKRVFWDQWSKDYLHQLQNRHKWKSPVQNIAPGTLVIIKDDDLPVMRWPMGRVVRTFPGKDGYIRVVEVKTASGNFTRPIHRLAPLPVEVPRESASEENLEPTTSKDRSKPSSSKGSSKPSTSSATFATASTLYHCEPSTSKGTSHVTYHCEPSTSKGISHTTREMSSRSSSEESLPKAVCAAASTSKAHKTSTCIKKPRTDEHSKDKSVIQDEEMPTSTTSTNEASEEPRPKKKKGTSFSSFLLNFFIVCCTLPLSAIEAIEDVEIQQFKHNYGIHFENIGTVNRMTSEWKLIVYYNLSSYWHDMAALTNGTTSLRQLCDEVKTNHACEHIANLIEQDAQELQIDHNLFTTRRMKRGAIDFIGNVANSLFGVLDSNYANEMSNIIDNVREDQSHLAVLIKNQTSVIESTINLLKTDQENVAKRFNLIRAQMNRIINDSTHEFNSLTALSLQLITINNKLHRTQSAITNLLTNSHHGIISPVLLSPQQLKQEIQKIKGQIPHSVRVPVEMDNILQLYRLMKAEGRITEKYVIFIVTLPLIDRTTYDLFSLISVPINQNGTLKAIQLSTNLVAINPLRDSYMAIQDEQFNRCLLSNHSTYFCDKTSLIHHKGATISSCEISLYLNGSSTNICHLKALSTKMSWTQLKDPNKWIFGLANPIRMQLVCGMRKAQIIVGDSGLLNLQPDCTLKHDYLTLSGYNSFSSKVQGLYAPGNILIQPEEIHLQSFDNFTYHPQWTKLNALLDSLPRGDLLLKASETHQTHHLLPGYLSMGITTSIIAFALWRYRRSILQCARRPQSSEPPSSDPDFTIEV